jgi:LPXTG-motif cell wall-anchored protein
MRLTVHAEGSPGADTKFKELRVGPCDETPPTTPAPTTTPIEPGSGPGTPPGTPPGGDPGPGPDAPATTATITPSASATGTLPITGSDARVLIAAGLALAGLGAGIVLAARLRRQN